MNEEQINALANILKEIFTPKEFIKVKDNMLSILDARLKKPEPKLEPSDEEAKLLQREANLTADENQLKDDKKQTVARLEALKQEQHEREYQLTVIDDRLNDIALELQTIHSEWASKHPAVHVSKPKAKRNHYPCLAKAKKIFERTCGMTDKEYKRLRNLVTNGCNKHATICGKFMNIGVITNIIARYDKSIAAEVKALYDERHGTTNVIQLELGI